MNWFKGEKKSWRWLIYSLGTWTPTQESLPFLLILNIVHLFCFAGGQLKSVAIFSVSMPPIWFINPLKSGFCPFCLTETYKDSGQNDRIIPKYNDCFLVLIWLDFSSISAHFCLLWILFPRFLKNRCSLCSPPILWWSHSFLYFQYHLYIIFTSVA